MKKTARILALSSMINIVAALSGCAQNAIPEQLTSSINPTQQTLPECVILLHGLARTSKSMLPFSEYLQAHQYLVVNVDYPSREFPIATLTEKAIPPALAKCRQHSISGIHFVAHSLGGILVRQYLSQEDIPELKRVVMLAPPNKGSQVVDRLKSLPPFNWINGPAGRELGTAPTSLPNSLGPVDFELGVIAGTTSINFILSLYLPNPDDGKVSLENTKVEGMNDFISLPVSHPYIMKDEAVMQQTVYFLQHGKFIQPPPPIDNKDL